MTDAADTWLSSSGGLRGPCSSEWWGGAHESITYRLLEVNGGMDPYGSHKTAPQN